jgi:hypothetical protein
MCRSWIRDSVRDNISLVASHLVTCGIDFVHVNIYNINKDLFIFNFHQIFN